MKESLNNSSPLVSVIIPNYNGVALLKGCLSSLIGASYPNVEFIMVDDASNDESERLVRERFPSVRVIRNPQNIGFSKASNLGIRAASGKYVILLNNDVEVEQGWLEPLVAEMESKPHLAACQPKILSLKDRNRFEYAGAAGGLMDYLGYPFLRGRIFETMEMDHGQYDDPRDIFWTSGAAMCIRKEDLDHTGLLDEDFVFHMEEVDLCWRMHLMGYSLSYVPQSRVYHIAGATIKPHTFMKIYYNHRNSQMMLMKNLGGRVLLPIMAKRFLLEFLTMAYAIRKGNLIWFEAVLCSLIWLFFHPGLIVSKRREVQRMRKVSDDEILKMIYPKSIVFDYYLRGKKKYSDL